MDESREHDSQPRKRHVVMSNHWQVYLLRCADGSLYTGIARDLERRVRQHNGELTGGARYTRGRRPVKLIWSEACESRSTAQIREAEIRRMSRSQKLTLIDPAAE